jgi:hypothetical protein
LKDLSDLASGEGLLDILSSYGLLIEKAGDSEPIRRDFDANNLPEMWKSMGIDGNSSSCYFLFKGKKEIKFTGMVTWRINVHPNFKGFNGIGLWLTIPKKYDVKKLVQLGDEVFTWSEAVYGYITEDSKDPLYDLRRGNINDGIPDTLWVNYFGAPYINSPDFPSTNNYVTIGHGIRFVLTETPEDERLNDLDFINSNKEDIGKEWFWSKPRNFNLKVPFFDRTAIIRDNIANS